MSGRSPQIYANDAHREHREALVDLELEEEGGAEDGHEGISELPELEVGKTGLGIVSVTKMNHKADKDGMLR